MSHYTDSAVVERPTVNLSALLRYEDSYSTHVGHFVTWAEGSGLGFTVDTVAEYFAYLNQTPLRAGTVRVKRAAVKKRIRQAAEETGLDMDTYHRLNIALDRLDHDTRTKAPKVNSRVIGTDKVFSYGEYMLLLEKAATARQRLFIRFLHMTGCRVSEMVNARLDKCDIQETRVLITVLGKGMKEREIKITRTLFDEIRQEFQGETYLFETAGGKPVNRNYPSRIIRNISKKYLGRSAGSHVLRHTFATEKIRQTHKVKAVSRYLGHSSTSITLDMYTHETLEDSELLLEEVAV